MGCSELCVLEFLIPSSCFCGFDCFLLWLIDVRERLQFLFFFGLEFLFFFPPRTEASLLVDCLFVVVWNSAAAYVKKIFCFLLKQPKD